MYIPANFKVDDLEALTQLISNHPLGLLISNGEVGITTSPLPFLLRNNRGELTLVAHIAKANKHWIDLQKSNDCLVIFSGHENYITPSWYPTKQTTHKVVPTWNYQIVEVRGKARVIEDGHWLRKQIGDLTDTMEHKRKTPWKVSDAPKDFIDSQIKGIVGIEIDVTAINGKYKMSQNKTTGEVEGVIGGLSNKSDEHHNDSIAEIVSKFKKSSE